MCAPPTPFTVHNSMDQDYKANRARGEERDQGGSVIQPGRSYDCRLFTPPFKYSHL